MFMALHRPLVPILFAKLGAQQAQCARQISTNSANENKVNAQSVFQIKIILTENATSWPWQSWFGLVGVKLTV